MSTVTLEGYQPPPRHEPDDELWDRARIERSSAPDGPWTVVQEAFGLQPPVTDPEHPPVYAFTVEDEGASSGDWYRVVWIDPTNTEQPTAPARWVQPPSWAPTVADVAAFLRARLHDDLGVRSTTFTNETNPTAQEVQSAIAQLASLVAVRVGNLDALPCPDAATVRTAAATLVTFRVAAAIEASYRPDEVDDDRTIADFLLGDDFKADAEAVVAAAAECRAWTPGDDGTPGDGPEPVGHFPCSPPLRW